MFGKIKEMKANLEGANPAYLDNVDKVSEEKHLPTINPLLMEGETVTKVYGLLTEFACITSDRLIFVDGNMATKKKKEIVSIFFRNIHEVKIDLNFALGVVSVETAKHEYSMQFGKGTAERFVKELVTAMR